MLYTYMIYSLEMNCYEIHQFYLCKLMDKKKQLENENTTNDFVKIIDGRF
jgi:hypothetical protein